MAKRKSEINFIASQKLVAKQNQSTSFEFVLIVTVIVLVVVMGTMYFMAIMNNKSAETNILRLNSELKSINDDIKRQKDKFAEFEVATDSEGNKIILSTSLDKNGNIVYTYKWLSINEVATSLAKQLDDANATSEAVQSQINLTSTIFYIIFSEADEYDCTVLSINYNNNKVSVALLGPTIYSWPEYKDALLRNTNTATGLDNTKYIKNIAGTAVNFDSTSGMYRFTLTFNVISDNLYLVESNGGAE